MNVAKARSEFGWMLQRALRDVAFTIHEKIVDRTPIDTGRAKASWRLNPNNADESVEPLLADQKNFSTGAVIEAAGPDEHPLFSSQAAAVARAQQQKIPVGTKVIVISNNLEYIEKLENGTSKQAQAGEMVAGNVTQDTIELYFSEALQKQVHPF